MYPRTVATLVVVMAVVALCATPTTNAQTLRVSLEQLSQEADDVIVGKTLRKESYWTADQSAILTNIVIQVEESLIGGPTGERTIVVPGGQVGEYIHEVSDMPVFTVDEEVVVFTQRHASGMTIVAGGAQGKLEVFRDQDSGVISVSGAGHLMQAEAGQFEASQAQVMDEDEVRVAVPLRQFVSRVKETVKGGR